MKADGVGITNRGAPGPPEDGYTKSRFLPDVAALDGLHLDGAYRPH
jgi:hypothetical protein